MLSWSLVFLLYAQRRNTGCWQCHAYVLQAARKTTCPVPGTSKCLNHVCVYIYIYIIWHMSKMEWYVTENQCFVDQSWKIEKIKERREFVIETGSFLCQKRLTFHIALTLLRCQNTLRPLLLTWFNFNPSMDNYDIHHKVWDEITYPFPNFNDCTVEIWNG